MWNTATTERTPLPLLPPPNTRPSPARWRSCPPTASEYGADFILLLIPNPGFPIPVFHPISYFTSVYPYVHHSYLSPFIPDL